MKAQLLISGLGVLGAAVVAVCFTSTGVDNDLSSPRVQKQAEHSVVSMAQEKHLYEPTTKSASATKTSLNQAATSISIAQTVQRSSITDDGNRVLSNDEYEKVVLLADQGKLIITNTETGELAYEIPMSELLLQAQLNEEPNFKIITEIESNYDDLDEGQDNQIVQQEEHELSHLDDKELDIYYDQKFSNGVIIRRAGIEEFIANDQLDTVLSK